MEFDKSRVYTTLNADELKVGSKVFFADDLDTLKKGIKNEILPLSTLTAIGEEIYTARFFDEDKTPWCLVYLVSEPEENKLRLKDEEISNLKKLEAQIVLLEKGNAELKSIVDFQTSRSMDRYFQLNKAKDLIRNLLRVTYGEGWNNSLDWKIKAEQFLKEVE